MSVQLIQPKVTKILFTNKLFKVDLQGYSENDSLF